MQFAASKSNFDSMLGLHQKQAAAMQFAAARHMLGAKQAAIYSV